MCVCVCVCACVYVCVSMHACTPERTMYVYMCVSIVLQPRRNLY